LRVKEFRCGVKIFLLKDEEGYIVPEIRIAATYLDIATSEKRYNVVSVKKVCVIASKIHKHKTIKITDGVEKKIIEVVTKSKKTIIEDNCSQYGHYCVYLLVDLLPRIYTLWMV
jgi:hypothetical protein